MTTNRTKIDWAYKMAKRFLNNDSERGKFGMRSNDPDDIRALASLLRRVSKRKATGGDL